MEGIRVGMKVYLKPTGANNTRNIRGNLLEHIEEAMVSRVGRKYFYLDGRDDKYDISTMEHTSEHHYDLKAYLSLQEIEDEIEAEKLESKIRTALKQYGSTGLSLEQLREINRIIHIDKSNPNACSVCGFNSGLPREVWECEAKHLGLTEAEIQEFIDRREGGKQ